MSIASACMWRLCLATPVCALRCRELVAPRRTISADNVDLPVGIVNGSGQIVKQVEQARIEVMDVTGAMIPKKVV